VTDELWLVALTMEALAVGGHPVETGVGPRRAARTVRRHLRAGTPDVVLNLGLGGGLAPGLRAGDVVLVTGWVDGPPSHPGWTRALSRRLERAGLRYTEGPALTVGRPLWQPQQKHEARERTGAALCEMEGRAVAEACGAAGVPVAAVRVVLDPADRRLERPPGPLPELPRALAALRQVGRALRPEGA